MKPIRFGLFTSERRISHKHWSTIIPKLEGLRYSTLFQQDHFDTDSYDPIVMLSAASTMTTKLNLGTLVFAVDYRHPVVLAKASAALHLISNGRHEFGIGAGYQPPDYTMSGLRYDPAHIRIDRLMEALEIIKMMWTQDRTTYNGKHYQLKEQEKAADLEDDLPKIMIGGGGKRMLRVAARYADIVGIVHRWKGNFGQGVREQTLEALKKKIEYVKSSATKINRDPNEIEFQLLSLWSEITDDPDPVIADLAEHFGISKEEVVNSEYVMAGTGPEIREKIQRIYDETDVSYFVISPYLNQVVQFSKEVIKPLLNQNR